MEAELTALEAALGTPKRPVVAVVGGAKISTKIALLANLVKKVDALVIGGGMANTFLAAQGKKIGKSLLRTRSLDTAREILKAPAPRIAMLCCRLTSSWPPSSRQAPRHTRFRRMRCRRT